MKVVVVGRGADAAALKSGLSQFGYQVVAQPAELLESTLDTLRAYAPEAVLVVAPEAGATAPAAVEALVRDGLIVAVYGSGAEPLHAWAASVGIPTLAAPVTPEVLRQSIKTLVTLEADAERRAEIHRRVALREAADRAAADELKVIAVGGPKGGVGKTRVAVDLSVLFALAGREVYLVDADANAGGSIDVYFAPPEEGHPTLLAELRRFSQQTPVQSAAPFGGWASGMKLLESFVKNPRLGDLRILYGFSDPRFADDRVLLDPRLAAGYIGQLVAAVEGRPRGMLIFDLGLNAALPLHREVLRQVRALAMVIKPETPDLKQAVQWLRMLVETMLQQGLGDELEGLLSRLKLVYNQVELGPGGHDIKNATRVLGDLFNLYFEDLRGVYGSVIDRYRPAPAATLPRVPVSVLERQRASGDVRDNPVYRYWHARGRDPELKPYVDELIGLAVAFSASVKEALPRLFGEAPSSSGRGGLFGLFRR